MPAWILKPSQMKNKMPAKRKSPGRPRLGKQRKESYPVMLEPAVAEKLRKRGDGNLAAGVLMALVAAELWDRSQ